jgi:hypothetical protein
MEGAYDVHLHANPSTTNCKDTILEIAEEARSYGMKGIVFKDLHFSTAPQALIVSEAVPGIDVIGGVSLNGTLGGLNPLAVEATFKLGGKVVWMFTLDSEFQVSQIFAPDYPYSLDHYRNLLVDIDHGGYSVFHKGTEDLKDEAREIIALCKQYDCVLETSHLSPQEAFAMVREGKAQGLKKMVVTHANQFATPYTIEQQKEFIELGAAIMYCYEAYMAKPTVTGQQLGDLGKLIRQIGVENIVLGTDFGAHFEPSGIEGIRMMIAGLLADNFTGEEIAQMVKTNADRLYGI